MLQTFQSYLNYEIATKQQFLRRLVNKYLTKFKVYVPVNFRIACHKAKNEVIE